MLCSKKKVQKDKLFLSVLLIQDTEEIARRYGVDVADGFLFGEAEGSGETPDELFGGVS